MNEPEKNSPQPGVVQNVNITMLPDAMQIKGLHPKITDALSATINEAKARGLSVGMNSGLRNAEEQEKLYAQGRSTPGLIVTNGRAFESWHNFGLAVDIVFKDQKGNWTWAKRDSEWEELGKIGELFHFEWGGRWTKLKDMPHFQMRGKIPNVHEAKSILLSEGRDKLWSLI